MSRVKRALSRLRRRFGFGPLRVAERLDSSRWRRLRSRRPQVAAGVVRGLYVAILEREPDPEGLALHANRLARGLPVEILIAELAEARNTERGHPAAGVGDIGPEVRDLLLAQQRTLRALARRLAVLEDRFLVEDGAPPSATGDTSR